MASFLAIPLHREAIGIATGVAAVYLAWKAYSAYTTTVHKYLRPFYLIN